MPIATDSTSPEKARALVSRCHELIRLNQLTAPYRGKIKDLINGGPEGIARVVGKDVNEDETDMVPVINQVLIASNRMGQKIGKRPDSKVDTPVGDDRQRAREHADKRARIIDSFDREANLELQLPQIGRWLPGYGFFVWVLSQQTNMNGDPFPMLELRDPFNAYPGVWSVYQQPSDICFRHTVPEATIEKMAGPGAVSKLQRQGVLRATSTDYMPREKGGVILGANAITGAPAGPSWANQDGGGVEVFEYINDEGKWWLLPEAGLVLAYVPNLLHRAPFVVGKRFAFDRLMGQYDQLIGLLRAQARLQMLSIAAAEMAVNAETNVIGDMLAGRYQKGKGKVNYLVAGSKVEKMNDRIPFEVMNHMNMIDRNIRAMATYPVTDDSISPNSFVTEVGLQELGGSIEEEYREYRMVIGKALEVADFLRLEWMDVYYPTGKYEMEGFREGSAFADTFTPKTHIDGKYRTRRVYGAMAGFDDANKMVVASILQDKEVISTDDFRENVDGLEDHARIKERIHAQKMELIMYELLSAGVQSMDPRIINLVIEEMPDGDRKEMFKGAFGEEAQQEEAEAQAPPGAGAPGSVPDVSTVLSRLTTGGGASGGVQTVGRS